MKSSQKEKRNTEPSQYLLNNYKIKPEFMNRRFLTQAEINEIKILRADGVSYNRIAEILNISTYTAYYYCLSERDRVEFVKKTRHRISKEAELKRQKMFLKRKRLLYKIGGLYRV